MDAVEDLSVLCDNPELRTKAMNMIELNEGAGKTALLIHPMLADAAIVRELIASRMGDGWHFLIPDLTGHGSAAEFSFSETAKEADDIHTWLEQHGILRVDYVWGASLGAAVAFAVMRYVNMTFGTMVLDGTPFMKAGSFMTSMIVKKMIGKHRKALKDRDLSVRKMTELYGAAGPGMAEEMINISEESLERVIRSCGSAVYPILTTEQQKHTAFIFGEKDYNAKPGLKKIADRYPDAEVKVLPGYAHCAMIGKDPDAYVKLITSYIK